MSEGKARILEHGVSDVEAIEARDHCVAKDAMRRADRPDPSLRNNGLLRITTP